jgi:hypothetical protein
MDALSPYAKAYAAAAVAVVLFVVDGFITGSFTDTSSIAPALTILLAPFVVYLVPNTPSYDVDDHGAHPVEDYNFDNGGDGNIIDPNV